MNLSVEEALSRIVGKIEPLSVVRLGLMESLGSVLAEEILSPSDWPSFTQSAMDGYALAHQVGATEYKVVGESAAGRGFDGEIKPGECVRIFTGARLPEGADTVVLQEEVERDGDLIRPQKLEVGAHIRFQGENLAKGAAALTRGTRIGAAQIGLLSALRISSLSVSRTPRALILSSGDELQYVEEPAAPGKIVNSNAYMLAALCNESGIHADISPILKDDFSTIEQAFRAGIARYDIVISSGGVSVGDHDHVQSVMQSVGEVDFWKIRMKPGKPLAFGLGSNGVPVFGLPGNPVSAFVCFQLFVRPALAKLQGAETSERSVKLETVEPLKSTPKRDHYISGRIVAENGVLKFMPVGSTSSGDITAFGAIEALACVPEGVSSVERGSEVKVLMI